MRPIFNTVWNYTVAFACLVFVWLLSIVGIVEILFLAVFAKPTTIRAYGMKIYDEQVDRVKEKYRYSGINGIDTIIAVYTYPFKLLRNLCFALS